MTVAEPSALDIEILIPELSSEIAMYEVDPNTFIVHQTEHDLRIKINSFTNRILALIDGKKSIKEITTLFNSDSKRKIPGCDVYALLYKGALATNGIIKSSTEIRTEHNNSYLKFRIPLLKAKTVYKVSHLFGFLYTPRTFYLSAFLICSALSIIFIHYLSFKALYNALTGQYVLTLAMLSFLTTLLHELGHATACRKFGAAHGTIGAGFYLFMPVFYADVSDIWKLKSSERVIVDFAGVYMELLISALLTTLFLVFHNYLFLTTSFFIIVQTSRNLNPFMRFDAYWAVTDYFNIPNLRKDSNLVLKQTLSSLVIGTANPLNCKKDYLFFAYSLLSMSFISIWLVLILFLDMNSVLYLPYNLFVAFKTIFLSFNTITIDWFKIHFLKLAIPISFYFIAGGIIVKQIQTKLKW